MKYTHLLDIGGGTGGVAIGACSRCPDLTATIIELPRIVPLTERYVQESGYSDRISIIGEDILNSITPGPFDIAILHHLVQVFSAGEAEMIIQKVHDAILPGGVIGIIGKVLEDSHLAPPQTVLFNMVFINTYDSGQAYTEQDHISWLKNAGFEQIEITNNFFPYGDALITAEKR